MPYGYTAVTAVPAVPAVTLDLFAWVKPFTQDAWIVTACTFALSGLAMFVMQVRSGKGGEGTHEGAPSHHGPGYGQPHSPAGLQLHDPEKLQLLEELEAKGHGLDPSKLALSVYNGVLTFTTANAEGFDFEELDWPGRLNKLTLSLGTSLLMASYFGSLAASLAAQPQATQPVRRRAVAGLFHRVLGGGWGAGRLGPRPQPSHQVGYGRCAHVKHQVSASASCFRCLKRCRR